MQRIIVPFVFVGIVGTTTFAQGDDDRLITIPVIFHVIYTDTLADNGMSDAVRNSQDGNSTTKLPKEKILSELKDLDQDFQRLNPDLSDVIPEFRSVIGNPKIHFVLKDIRYVSTTPEQISQPTNSGRFRELAPMENPESCLNVYVSRLKVGGRGSEGVTNVPTTKVELVSDGVNLNFSWVGLHYRLLSHEVGHWLGLWHVDDKSQITKADISDIPVQNKLTDISCVRCTRRGVVVIARQRDKFTNPNTNNFMDYSGCRRMFSIQQSAYMRNVVIRLRKEIWHNSPKAVR